MGLAVLEKTETQQEQKKAMSAEELQHIRDMEMYRKALYSSASPVDAEEEQKATEPAYSPAPAPAAQETSYAPAYTPSYTYAPAEGRHILFEGVVLRDGEIVRPAPEVSEPAASVSTVAEPAPQTEIEDEDALPTRRTMDTLLHSVAQQGGTERKTSLVSALSTKTKVVLLAVAFAVVLAIVLVCVNTGIISSLNANIAEKSAQANELVTKQQQLEEEIEALTDPSNVQAWAEAHGMVKEEIQP